MMQVVQLDELLIDSLDAADAGHAEIECDVHPLTWHPCPCRRIHMICGIRHK